MLALLTFLSVCACVRSIFCFSVPLFSLASEIRLATPPKESLLGGATHICGTVSPPPATLSLLCRGRHRSLMLCRTPSCPGAGTDEHFQSPASKGVPPSIVLPSPLACDLAPRLKPPHFSGKQPALVATHTSPSKSPPEQHAGARTCPLSLPNCLSIIAYRTAA